MPEGIYREMLADRLAAQVGMPAAALKKSFSAGDGARKSEDIGPEPSLKGRGRISVGRGNLLTQAITLVLHHPRRSRHGQGGGARGRRQTRCCSLKDLLARAAAASSPSTAMLLERWRDLPEYDRLAELAMAELLVAPEAAAKELQMAVEKLLKEYRFPVAEWTNYCEKRRKWA